MRAFAILAFAVASAACLRVDVPGGALKCSSNPDRRCPEGYFCADDDTCWKNGSTPVLRPSSLSLGSVCTHASDCASGHCVDSFCCDTACDGGCQACDVGGGICTVIKGIPHGPRPHCGVVGEGVCALTCNGIATECTFPNSRTPCGAQSCTGSPPMLNAAKLCDGHGHCVVPNGDPTTPCPAPPNAMAVCAGDSCDFTCDPPYVRDGTACVAGDMM